MRCRRTDSAPVARQAPYGGTTGIKGLPHNETQSTAPPDIRFTAAIMRHHRK